MSGSLLVAVDGGNSKTDVVLLRADGGVAAAVRGEGSNPHSLGRDGALDVIERLISAARARAAGDMGPAPETIAAGAFFLAGADQPDEERDLRAAIARRGWVDDAVVGNDTLALLWAGSHSGVGVAVVVGTGINGVGRAPSGAEARFAALGEVTGDWGGGLGIGLAALGAAVRAEDGRGATTALGGLIAAHFRAPAAVDVAIAVHRQVIAAGRLAELAPLVFAAARSGDSEATGIVDRQADEVVGFAVAALRRVGATADPVEVVLGGSVLTSAPDRLLDRVRAGIAAVAPRADVVLCTDRPVVGAALAVLHHHGSDECAGRRLRAELSAERFAIVPGGGQTW